MKGHNLFKTGDADAPEAIKDMHGVVVLACCRYCLRAESELSDGVVCDKSIEGVLLTAIKTAQSRHDVYGDNWRHHGEFIASLYPAGLVLKNAEDFTAFLAVNNVAMKLYRYCSAGGHKDSAHDLIVYSAMLEILTKEK